MAFILSFNYHFFGLLRLNLCHSCFQQLCKLESSNIVCICIMRDSIMVSNLSVMAAILLF